MIDASTDANRVKVRDMLGAFLFSGDDVHKKVRVLSGGERNRLALCKMMLSPFNVLIMDEPTNHLDIASKNVLKKALNEFEGTLIVVSHDRDFLKGLSKTVSFFKDRVIKEYLGNIDYFLEQHNIENLREAEKRTVVVQVKESSNKEDYLIKKEQDKRLNKIQNRVAKVEKLISTLEKEIINLDAQLSNDFESTSKQEGFFEKYQGKKHKLESLMSEWEELHEQLNEI